MPYVFCQKEVLRRYKMTFELMSTAIIDGWMDKKYGNQSDPENIINDIPQISFPMNWKGIPEGTESFAIIFMDNDNAEDEGFPFVHWLACNIPGHVTKLEENASREADFFLQGTNSWSTPFGPYEGLAKDLTFHFGGPAPGCTHEYEVTIYALDQVLELKTGFFYNDLRKAMRGHILSEATLLFNYG